MREPEPEYDDTIIEWIPYNQFDEIKETGKTGYMTVYSAIWKEGPLYKKNKWNGDYIRDLNKEIALYCLHINDSQDSVDFLINEAKKYSTNHGSFLALYGISQNPSTNDYILVLKHHIMTSGNEKIDYFIKERQLLKNKCEDIIIEWIPYNQFNIINETGKIGHVTIYSAIWKDGPLYKESKWSENYIRNPNKEVALNCLHINNSQDPVDFLINEAKKYSTKHESFLALYGLSQNPNTNDYILVINNHTLLSGNEKIDYFIYEKQLRRYQYENTGPLYKKNKWSGNYIRDLNKEIALYCLHINDSQDSVDFLINEAKKYSTNHGSFLALYGISQNPNTNDYILVLKHHIMTSGNEKIDYFINERQLLKNKCEDIIIEWIPYNQFNEINETGKIGHVTIYSAIWKDGPLYKESKWSENYIRNPNKKVALNCLHINNSQDPVDFLINEVKKYSTKHESFLALYGLSQDPDTYDYILVINNHTLLSGHEKIDYFIYEKQLRRYKYDDYDYKEPEPEYEDTIIEWIPYNQFDEIKETGKTGYMTVYSAIWKDGPLYKEYKWSGNYKRDLNKEIALYCLHIDDSQDSVDFLINEAKKYSANHGSFLALYGISQNPNTNDYILVLKHHIMTSGNEKIDYFINGRQLLNNKCEDIIIEWIPYSHFNKINETGKIGHVTIYSAIWKDGPLYKESKWSKNYKRDPNKKVALNCLHINNSQDPVDFLINEATKYSTKHESFLALYGLSQNPDTYDYILVINNHTLSSGNEKIDYFIYEKQLRRYQYENMLNIKVYSNTAYEYEYDDYDYTEPEPEYDDTIIEWIPYNQFDEIKETGKIGYMTVYSAIWKDGPLYKEYKWSGNYIRDLNKEIALYCLHINDSQDSVDFLINEAKKYSTNHGSFLALYGISQNPNTNDYILVLKHHIMTSGNEKIDYFINERQLLKYKCEDIIIEWIPYNQFNEINETGKIGHVTIYSAIWKDGPLYKESKWSENYIRDPNKEVALNCLHINNSQDPVDFLINEAKKYLTIHEAFLSLYGISQNPNTYDYILVINNHTLICGNEKIDYFIYEKQLYIDKYEDTHYISSTNYYTRDSNKEVALRLLHINSSDPIDFLINEAKKYSTKRNAFLALYGISQNPNTNDYILVQKNYTLISGNEKIDYFIHEMQLNIKVYSDTSYRYKYDDYDYTEPEPEYDDTIIEWIPYNQLDEIKETGKIGYMTKNNRNKNFTRDSNKEVVLKCLHISNSQDHTDFLINEARNYSTKHNAFLALDSNKEVVLRLLHDNLQDPIDFLINETKKYSTKYKSFLALYGISQHPNTNDYILVQNNYILTSGNEKIDGFIHEMQSKMDEYEDTVIEWIPYNQFDEIKEISKGDHNTAYSAIWKDGPLYKEGLSGNYRRNSNEEVALNCLHINNSQDPIDFLINEAKKYSTKYEALLTLYGISQNPNTNDYILVQSNDTLANVNEIIDDFIQQMHQ
ncbi:kinase-like domain-containing protein [Rhizophagus clarus]|uniref:Kinase-like domain-containing protein n=1 Tax=Rhizophagus clarus TaxID=94130 RepID=A0A8H3LCT2_9GLOM|nr:kinase-like domain-containing protein [Rhizophagus clarus]